MLGNPAENLNIGIVNFDKSTENGQLREKGFRDTVLNDDRANITASINVKSTITTQERAPRGCCLTIRRSM